MKTNIRPRPGFFTLHDSRLSRFSLLFFYSTRHLVYFARHVSPLTLGHSFKFRIQWDPFYRGALWCHNGFPGSSTGEIICLIPVQRRSLLRVFLFLRPHSKRDVNIFIASPANILFLHTRCTYRCIRFGIFNKTR